LPYSYNYKTLTEGPGVYSIFAHNVNRHALLFSFFGGVATNVWLGAVGSGFRIPDNPAEILRQYLRENLHQTIESEVVFEVDALSLGASVSAIEIVASGDGCDLCRDYADCLEIRQSDFLSVGLDSCVQVLPANSRRRTVIFSEFNIPTLIFYGPFPFRVGPFFDGFSIARAPFTVLKYCELGPIVCDQVWFGVRSPGQTCRITEIYELESQF
jgi:hypothetical protein